MEWLNYHHLLYFWVVAKEGSVVAAGKELRLAHPTISGQIHKLEQSLGEKLLVRQGRNLVLTEAGRVAFRYADEIFTLGREFLGTVKGRSSGRPARLVVAISNVLPKDLVRRILEPVFQFDPDIRLVCREDRSTEAFMGELATHAIDLLLADAPAGPGTAVRAFSHLIGECGTVLFATASLATSLKRRFPRSLDGAPFLLPRGNSMLRRGLDAWFDSHGIRPKIVAELDDTALARTFGEAGLGVFAMPSVVRKDIERRFQVKCISEIDELRQRFYAISIERKIRHPAVIAIREAAKARLFV